MRDYSRLDAALDGLESDLYADIPQSAHIGISQDAAKRLAERGILKAGIHALDVGAGCGGGEGLLRGLGCQVICIDLAPQNVFTTQKMDQSFMPPAWDDKFDLIWARHVLEHSIMPLYTLMEYCRVLKPGGHAYVEVPAPNTEAHHECNANHYSVLGLDAWANLMQRLFKIVDPWQYNVDVAQPDGSILKDIYWAFLLQKEAKP